MYPGEYLLFGDGTKGGCLPGVEDRLPVIIAYVLTNPAKGLVVIIIYHMVVRDVLAGGDAYYQGNDNQRQAQRPPGVFTNRPRYPEPLPEPFRQPDILYPHQAGPGNDAHHQHHEHQPPPVYHIHPVEKGVADSKQQQHHQQAQYQAVVLAAAFECQHERAQEAASDRQVTVGAYEQRVVDIRLKRLEGEQCLHVGKQRIGYPGERHQEGDNERQPQPQAVPPVALQVEQDVGGKNNDQPGGRGDVDREQGAGKDKHRQVRPGTPQVKSKEDNEGDKEEPHRYRDQEGGAHYTHRGRYQAGKEGRFPAESLPPPHDIDRQRREHEYDAGEVPEDDYPGEAADALENTP